MPLNANVVPGLDSTEHGISCQNGPSRMRFRSSLSDTLSFAIIEDVALSKLVGAGEASA